MKHLFQRLLAMVVAVISMGIMPAGAVVDASVSAKILTNLSSARPDLQFASVELSPLPGIYQVQVEGGPMLYVSADGAYFIAGDLFSVGTDGFVNLQEIQRQKVRADLIAAVPAQEQIIFSPKSAAKGYITVFTDIDCGYCRKLHREIPQLMDKGIEVRYLAYPRAGLNSESYQKLATAWCAKDRQATLTKLKQGASVDMNVCANNPVARQLALGDKIGVRGTPAIVLPDGTMLPGYLPADQLAKALGLE